MIPRIGIGYDVHRLGENRDFCLGGIVIPFDKGCIAHSDGDVLIHAICDSLFGAAGLRDIGHHFPDTSDEFKNIDSKILLEKTVGIIKKNSFVIGNIDTVICLQEPKINKFIPEIIKTLSKIMEISEKDISVKPTTTENLGFIGNGEGISAYSTALIFKK